MSRWHPDPPAADRFPLTAAQLVLAREHGFPSWARLRRYVQVVTARAWTPGKPAPDDESLDDRFLRLVCLTYSDDRPANRAAAAQLLAEHPELPRRDSFGWSPLLYQADARHDPHVEQAATLETAQLLLDAGADPNDGRFWARPAYPVHRAHRCARLRRAPPTVASALHRLRSAAAGAGR